MVGFFDIPQEQSIKNTCAACGLYKNVLNPMIKPHGNFKKGIMNIGEAPGEIEDRRGKPWQGKVGKLLQQTYESLGIDLFEDCININAANCRPTTKTSNRPPTYKEIECCRKQVTNAISQYKPHTIVVFGKSALLSVLGHRWKKNFGQFSKWRGWTIPDQDYNAWICPVFHPSFVSRNEREVMTIWKQDLNAAINTLSKSFPSYHSPKVHIIDNLSLISDIKSSDIAFDYETTGLKPYHPDHKIICGSVAYNQNCAYAFMIPNSFRKIKPFTDLLKNPHISKYAHNMKFEDNWTNVKLNIPIYGWKFDSMLSSHILDNRPGITSLKFQTYVQFGIVDYDSEVQPYLEAKEEKNGNSFNRIYELLQQPQGKEKLLHYCGLDSIYEYRLAYNHQSILDYDFLPF